MTMKAVVYYDHRSPRSCRIGSAMWNGIMAHGDRASLVAFDEYKGPEPDADCVAYGWGRPEVFHAYRRCGRHYVHIDLGWWNRKPIGDVLGGHHKVAVNGRDPSAYFARNFTSDRVEKINIPIKPWRPYDPRKPFLIGGMSEKSCRTFGLEPEAWERAIIRLLMKEDGAKVTYRPKPSWAGAFPIAGAGYSVEPIDVALAKARMVITHHSNLAIDALIAGIPVHVAYPTVAAAFSTPIEEIATPWMPPGREQLLADIAWQQWTPDEMTRGECWKHLKEMTPLCT